MHDRHKGVDSFNVDQQSFPRKLSSSISYIGSAILIESQSSQLALPKVLIVVVTFNHIHDLHRCLVSLLTQDYSHLEIVVIDNESTDGSAEYVSKHFPEVHLIRSGQNLGYASANNLGFARASGDYIVAVNPDTEVQPGWLRALIIALQKDPAAGLATSKIMLMDQPDRINTCGNDITMTSLTFCRGLGKPACWHTQSEVVPAVSGAAFAIRRRTLEEIGGFDEDFFLYYEDTDLSLRAQLAGYTCLYVPESVVLHKYIFKFSPSKCFYQERNRYYTLLKIFRWRTLLVMLPLLLLAEILVWGYIATRGPAHARAKLASYRWLLTNWRRILSARRRTQALRRVDDRVILRRFGTGLPLAYTASPGAVALLQPLLELPLRIFGTLIRALIRW